MTVDPALALAWTPTQRATLEDLDAALGDRLWVVASRRGGEDEGVIGQMPNDPSARALWQFMVRCARPFRGSLLVEYENVTEEVARVCGVGSHGDVWFDRKTRSVEVLRRPAPPSRRPELVPLLLGPFGVGEHDLSAALWLNAPLSRGHHYYVAYHPDCRLAVLRHKSGQDLERTWLHRRWSLFPGDPRIADVTDGVARVIVERLSANAAWRARHAIVLQDLPTGDVELANVPIDRPCRFYHVKWNAPSDVLPWSVLGHPDADPPLAP